MISKRKILNYSKHCFPIEGLRIDIGRFVLEVEGLFNYLRGNGIWDDVSKSVNITHRPDVQGNDRWIMHSGSHESLRKSNVRERELSVFNSDLIGSYIHEVYNEVAREHERLWNTPFCGRTQLLRVDSGFCYPLHNDPHTPHRYHMAVYTHEDCVWIFQNPDWSILHMPADGRVWYVDPVNQRHSVANMSTVPRWHFLMTDGLQ